MTIYFKRIKPGAVIPEKQTAGSAGFDAAACIAENVPIKPGGRALIPTGLSFEMPENAFVLVLPRSSPALRQGVTLMNSPGLIDSDYRGEVGVILVNLGEAYFTVKPGMRIAQFLPLSGRDFEFVEAECLSETERGQGGFGSTGN